jgi:hypothetical protein
VEWLFSNLREIQGVQCSKLTVDNFKHLGKLCRHYMSILIEEGLLTQHQHAHMHTHLGGGINVVLAEDLKSNMVLPAQEEIPELLYGPKTLSTEDINAAFDKLNAEQASVSLPWMGLMLRLSSITKLTRWTML